MAKRESIYIDTFAHQNPIPAACRIGNLLMSGIVTGRDAATKTMPPTLEAQCANVFAHIREIVEAAGGSTDDIIKVTVWMADRAQRDPVNREWLNMFPDPHNRPARQAMQADLNDEALVHCDFVAVLGSQP